MTRAAVLLALAACSHDATPPASPAWPPTRDSAGKPGPYHDPDHKRGALPGEASRRDELSVVRKSLDRMYAHRLAKLTRYQLDEEAIFAEAERRLLAATSWSQYDDAIYDTLAKFHDGHLTYHPPSTAAPARGYTSFHLGLDTVLARDHVLVSAVEPDSDVAKAGVKPGDEVVAIDGKPIAAVLAHAAAGRAASRDESSQDSYVRTWSHVLIPVGDTPRTRQIEVQTRGGARLTVAIAPREAAKEKREVATVAREGNVAIATIRTLEGNRKRGEKIDEALASARDARGLVIDLRGDRGGTDLVGYRVIAGLAEGNALLGTYRVLVADETLALRPKWRKLVAEADGFSPVQPITIDAQPPGKGFHGPVAVVVDAGCVSTCELVVSALHADLHATVVGVTTGGSSGAPVEVTLPTGAKIAIPTWNLLTVDGKPIEDDGVVPDLDVVATPDSLAAGVDLPLRTAIDDVKHRLPP